MSIGLFSLSSHNLTRADYRTAVTLAAWIEKDMPCVTGNIPAEYTEELSRIFVRHSVPSNIVMEAFAILNNKGVHFDYPVTWPIQYIKIPASKYPDPDKPGDREPQQMKSLSGPESVHMMHGSIEIYEGKFRAALAAHNAADAQHILAAVLDLLMGLAKGYGKTRKSGSDRDVKLQEWKEWYEAVNEALERAETLETHIRRLTRQEVTELRDAPGPDGLNRVTFRLSHKLAEEAVEEEEEEESEKEAE